MFRVALVGEDRTALNELCRELGKGGLDCSSAPDVDFELSAYEQRPDVIVIDYDSIYRIADFSRTVKDSDDIPVIALVRREMLGRVSDQFRDVDDFLAKPLDSTELQLRIKRLLGKNASTQDEETLRCGELVIDTAKCEVSVAGRPIVLTYKEYELLKFLVSNQGRVCTREMLLDKVWGIDYFGGDRTVDVHIRRLRSKVEDPAHTFIETVRNIGYRMKVDD